MTAPRPVSPESGKTASPLREIVSFSVSPDSTATVVGLKLALADGGEEMVLMALPVARHLHDTLLATLRSRGSRPELPADARFFERMPVPVRADWVLSEATVSAPIGCHIETCPDMCLIEFPLRDRPAGPRFALRPLYAAYLMHALDASLELAEAAAEAAGTPVLH